MKPAAQEGRSGCRPEDQAPALAQLGSKSEPTNHITVYWTFTLYLVCWYNGVILQSNTFHGLAAFQVPIV
jgi:hypothetical protein